MKLILTILLLISLNTTAQKHWALPTQNDGIGYVCLVVAGRAEGVNEAIKFHGWGKGNPNVDINISWKNKYKDWDGGDYRPAYIGAKTWLVWTTDMYHFTKVGNTVFTTAGTVFICLDLKDNKFKGWKKWGNIILTKILYPSLIKKGVFELTYKNFSN